MPLEAVADRMRELLAQGRDVLLRSAERRQGPSTRRVVMQLGEESARVEQRSRARIRIEWAPGRDPLDALRRAQEHAERSGLTLREALPQPDGTIRLIVGCP